MKEIRSRLDIHKRRVRIVPRLAMITAALLILFFGSSKLATISWANSTTVSIDPDPQGVILGDTATTDVLVENVTDLNCVQFDITFDPTLVEVVDALVKPGVQIQPGDFLSPDWILDNTVDNANGTIACAFCEFGGSASGSGPLATITWRGKAVGTSFIRFDYLLLSALGGKPIDASTQDGEITVGEGFTVTFVSAAYESVTNQTTFTYTVSADGGQGYGMSMSNWELEGCLPYYVDDSGSGTGYDPQARIDVSITYTQVVTGTWTEDSLTIQGMKWGGAENSAGQADPLGDQNAAETDVFTYALRGNWENSIPTDPFLAYRLNFGAGIDPMTGWIRGPDCAAGPTAVTLSSLAAKSNAGLEASFVWAWLVGIAALAVGGVLWVRSRANRLGGTRESSN